MFRITTHDSNDGFVMKLEGSLSGAWVVEAGLQWRRITQRHQRRPVTVDLRGVCHVDDDGRKLLTLMHLDGAEFITSGCEMPEIVREIAYAEAEPAAAGRRN
jgi:anti-anti-sigma regulatory factor